MLHLVSTILLGPLLLIQGRHVRRTVERLPEPEGPRAGQHFRSGAPAVRLLIVGDSAAAGVGAARQDDALAGRLAAQLGESVALSWRLHAATGASTADTCAALDALLPEPCDVVISSLGVNDVTGGASLPAWRASQLRLIALLRERFAPRLIVLSALPPMHRFPALPQPLRWYLGRRARQFNAELERIARLHADCEFAQFDMAALDTGGMASDGFHPGPPVYRAWADFLANRIRARLPG